MSNEAQILNHAGFTSTMREALLRLHSAESYFGRKHRLNPDAPEYQTSGLDPNSFKLLMLAKEAVLTALEINQKATQPHGDLDPLREWIAEPVLEAAAHAMARATQRRLDSELYCLRRLGWAEPQGTHPHTEDGRDPNPGTTENGPSGDCLPL